MGTAVLVVRGGGVSAGLGGRGVVGEEGFGGSVVAGCFRWVFFSFNSWVVTGSIVGYF